LLSKLRNELKNYVDKTFEEKAGGVGFLISAKRI
jgi:hypothetical protein